MLDDAAGPGHGNFAVNCVLAAQLAAHQQHKLDQIGRCLRQNCFRNRVAGQGQLADGRSQRSKIRSWRAVAQIDQAGQVGRAPDFANFFKNLRRLLAVMRMERPPNAVDADPVAGTLVT